MCGQIKNLIIKLWIEDSGAIIASEYIFVLTILIIGLITGLKTLQSAILNEYEDISGAIGAVSQEFEWSGTNSCCSHTSGSRFSDQVHTYPITTCSPRFNEGEVVSCPD